MSLVLDPFSINFSEDGLRQVMEISLGLALLADLLLCDELQTHSRMKLAEMATKGLSLVELSVLAELADKLSRSCRLTLGGRRILGRLFCPTYIF